MDSLQLKEREKIWHRKMLQECQSDGNNYIFTVFCLLSSFKKSKTGPKNINVFASLNILLTMSLAMSQVKMVEIWMNAVKEQADDMLEQGCRMQVDRRRSSGSELKMKAVTLSEEEIITIKWVKDLSLEEIPMKESSSCPQQQPAS